MKRILLVLMLAIGMVFVGCSQEEEPAATEESTDTGETIEVATSSLFVDTMEEVKKVFDENSEYTLEVTLFDDYTTPNTALAEGSIDATVHQHKSFLDAYNESNNTDLIFYEDYQLFTAAEILYSVKVESINEIKEGDKIGISNDPSNIATGLLILEDQGLIKIKEGVDQPGVLDIEENPLNLELIELGDGRDVFSALEDVTVGITTGVTVLLGDMDPSEALAIAPKTLLEKNAIGIAIKPEDSDEKWVEDLYNALTDEKIVNFLHENYPNALIPAKDF